MKKELTKMKSDREKIQANYEALNKKMDVLQDSYTALEKNSEETLKVNMVRNRELLNQLEAKEKALTIEQEKLNKNAKRLKELEDDS
jgi:chemotaxis protein MotB